MTSTELVLGFAVPFAFMVLGYWQKEVWLFYWSSAMWLVFMGFLFNNYNSTEFWYYIAYTLLIPAIVCATAQLWMNRGKPMPTLDTKESPSEIRAKKIRSLRNIGSKLSGKDDWE